jgi:enterochelin esterase-like enzyme
MPQSAKSWLLRGIIVIVLAGVVALWVLTRPALAPSTPNVELGVTPTEEPTFTPTPAPTPTPTPVPTITPLPTIHPTPTPTQTSTPMPVLSEAEGPTPTPAQETSAPAAEATETPTMPPLAGRMEQHTYFSQVSGQEESCQIYLPPDYDQTDRRYPVLYLLHGWPYAAADWDSLGVEEVADASIQAGTLPPFIIVLPRSSERMYNNTAGGDQSFEGQVISDLIPYVDATHRTMASRDGRAIGGISRGGVWSLEIAFRHIDLFAAVGTHSPALKDNMAPTVYDPFYLLQHPDVASLRIYVSAGDTDWASPAARSLHEALDERSIPHQFIVHLGGHAAALWTTNLAEYLAFYTAGWAASL